MTNSKTVSVIIINWNQSHRTIECLKKLCQWSYPKNCLDIIVQDNASIDESWVELQNYVQALRSYGYQAKFNRLDRHPGVTKSFNIALELVDPQSEFVLRLDNDVSLEKDALRIMVDKANSLANAGVVGPKIYFARNPQKLNSAAVSINKYSGKSKIIDAKEVVESDTLLGCVMLVRKAAVHRLKRWFDPGLFLFREEFEFCNEIRKLGYLTYYIPNAVAYHDAGTCTRKHSKLNLYLEYRNSVIVLNKATGLWPTLIRNLLIVLYAIRRCIREANAVPLFGFIDGFMKKPLTEDWWNKQIYNSKFTRPNRD